MNKKPRLILTTIFAITLIILSSNLMLQSAHAQVTSPNATPDSQTQPQTTSSTSATINQQANQSFCTFMNQVAGINLGNFKVMTIKVSTSQLPGSTTQKTCIAATISSNSAKLIIAMVLIEDKVRFYELNVPNGTLSGSQLESSALLAKASTAINNYQTYFNASYCSQFNGLFPTTMQSSNFSISENGKSLDIQISNSSAKQLDYLKLDMIKNTNAANGVSYPLQSITATLSRTGIITYFTDSLGIFTVDTNAAISKEQAISTATPYINAYAANNSRRIQTVDASFGYENGFTADRDSLTIYPLWTVTASLDNSSSSISGYYVAIWADNGQVQTADPIGTHHSEANYSVANTNISIDHSPGEELIVVGLIIAFASPTLTAFALYQKKNNLWTKKTTFKLAGILLILVSLCSLAFIKSASATYHSSILGQYFNHDPHPVPDPDPDENHYEDLIAGNISLWSSENYYTVTDNHGTTDKSAIYAAANDQGSGGSIAFYLGEGDPYQSQYPMNSTDGWVNATMIMNHVNNAGRQKLVVLWSCYSGFDMSYFPKAWLSSNANSYISDDGYAAPDYTGRTFIGFRYGAPYIVNTQSMNGYSQERGGYWLLHNFYDYALNDGFTINEALDASTNDFWGESFGASDWYTSLGMVVYGDGYKIISAVTMHISAYGPENDELKDSSAADVYIDGTYSGTTPGDFTFPYSSTVTLEDPVYDYNLWCYVYFASRSTDGSTYYTAYYNYE